MSETSVTERISSGLAAALAFGSGFKLANMSEIKSSEKQWNLILRFKSDFKKREFRISKNPLKNFWRGYWKESGNLKPTYSAI